ncbi:hypothetical protein PAXRUDRAFT_789518 [Paxillus rubicundulus Ve08.2h10]|uniref:Uncharacterized protein n=1 Tax=Paxillus rubicundulus Ve08.2h10 TaxID=930991 RepID=A0A0D0CH64_9AGAM|nr:hypothetical protein PAXRUDRAFT_789518 [Paxillus rubicundulus Ve08.2h10]
MVVIFFAATLTWPLLAYKQPGSQQDAPQLAMGQDLRPEKGPVKPTQDSGHMLVLMYLTPVYEAIFFSMAWKLRISLVVGESERLSWIDHYICS